MRPEIMAHFVFNHEILYSPSFLLKNDFIFST